MKYKKLTKEQIVISLDRLTRFKNTKEKYLRVFTDIIISNLIEPKLRKADLAKMEFAQIRNLAQEIFNGSLEERSLSDKINKKLRDYENTIYNNDDSTQELLNNNIDYVSAFKYINHESVINLRWLKSLAADGNLVSMREEHCLKFPIEKVLLVEGITEEILLPAFSKFLGYDFYQNGIQIIPAGGKNQVVKMYYKLSEELKIPIFLLLDRDAEENISQIMPRLRNIDRLHLVSCGEFEDLLPKTLIVKTVNAHFENFVTITEDDLLDGMPEAKNLENIFKTRGLHEFKKADFAKLVRDNIFEETDISPEIADIIKEIAENNHALDTRICS